MRRQFKAGSHLNGRHRSRAGGDPDHDRHGSKPALAIGPKAGESEEPEGQESVKSGLEIPRQDHHAAREGAERRIPDGPRTIRYTALGALAGGMMILAGYFQTALYGFLALGLFALSGLWSNRQRWLRSVPIVIGIAAGAAAVAAIQVLPGLELTAHSIRAAADYFSSTEGTLHLRPLLTLFAPDSLGAISGNYTGPFDVTQYYLYAGLLLV